MCDTFVGIVLVIAVATVLMIAIVMTTVVRQ